MLIQKFEKDIFLDYSSSIITPKLIQIKPNLVIALFELMKLIPAKYTIMQAISEDKIDPLYPIVETSSGTYALGLGIVCASLKIPFFIISDSVIDEGLKNRLEELGGKVQIISHSDGHLDIQALRLQSLNEYLINNKQAFWPSQYDNPNNRKAYAHFANYLLDNIGTNFTLVGSVGSGGSTCGTIQTLRQINNKIKLIGVDTFGSVLFGLTKKERKLRGLGNSIMPKNLIHEYFDQVHWINQECAFKSTRELHASKGLFCGPTTGAAYHVANWIAENNVNENIVIISPDSGYRYISTVYNSNWLETNKINLFTKFYEPNRVLSLSEAKEPWSYFDWNRRNYKEIVNINHGII